MATSVSKVFLWVRNYQDARRFWRDALQLPDVGDNPNTQYGAVWVGAVLIEFQQIPPVLLQKIQTAEASLTANQVEIPREFEGKIFRFDIMVDSLATLRTRLANLNIPFVDVNTGSPQFLRVDVSGVYVRIFEAPNG